jgi:iron(II)-dependent oxidoreductase
MFPGADSPYGCLDMAGQVLEWTTSLWGKSWSEPEFKYPYRATDGRENLDAGDTVHRVVRGGAFYYDREFARCAFRLYLDPNFVWGNGGFRVVVSPISQPARSLP